ncbi:MAG: thioesterase family protein, partial [Thermoleophilaceae bacterium]|nr:thioesterase family protein [Thermoleophilaceae bacterium]
MDSSPAELVPFAAATAVKPIGDGQYTSAVDPSWDGPLSTHGGVLASIALNAVDAEVNADQALHPRTFSCHYLRPPAHGEVTVAVRQLRAGRRVVSSAFELLSEGRLCVTGLVSHVVRGLPEVASWMPILPDVAPQPQRDAGCIAPDDFRRKCGKWVEFPPQAPKFLQQM